MSSYRYGFIEGDCVAKVQSDHVICPRSFHCGRTESRLALQYRIPTPALMTLQMALPPLPSTLIFLPSICCISFLDRALLTSKDAIALKTWQKQVPATSSVSTSSYTYQAAMLK